jgi:hypothetical protein
LVFLFLPIVLFPSNLLFAMEAPSRANAILVLHAPTLDPHPFLSRERRARSN